MQLYVIRRPSAWASLAELEAAGARSAKVGEEFYEVASTAIIRPDPTEMEMA